ncbi:MAG: hypothetical protein FJW38_07750 [Acidobacteria bacterium]|nr:hypothetical protein [Acidobacteriota bacterium]
MTAAPASPYVGAEPLSHDNPIFGRDREIRDLFFLLSKERIALLYSPSGAGKSSILYARNGLLDQFVDRFDVLPVTRVNTETTQPGANRYALSMLVGLERFAESPRKDSELASLSLHDAVMSRPSGTDGRLTLVVVDQFEEIVRIDPTDIDGKREFFRQLGELLAEPTIWALFVLREDFLATLDPYIRQLPTHLKNRFRIDLLKPGEAAKAISGPAAGLERTWDPEAAQKLAYNLAAETGVVEPMHLQIVCQDIWTGMRDDDIRIDPEDVTEFGDVDVVLGRFYARIASDAAKLGHNSEREIRNWVGSKLVVKGGVRGQVLAAEAELHDKTVEILDKAHLVRREPRRGADWLELAHDRLVPAVTKDNTAWFEKNLSDLERRAEQWDEGGRSEDLLADGAPYREMRAWAKQNPERVKTDEKAFLLASKRKAAATMWRRVSTAVSLALAIIAFILFGNAQREKNNAEAAGLRARFSQATLYDDRAAQAHEKRDFPDAWLYTLGALAEDWPANANLPDAAGRLLLPEIRPDMRWNDIMKKASFKANFAEPEERSDFGDFRAICAQPSGGVRCIAGMPDKRNENHLTFLEFAESNARARDTIFTFKKNEDGFSKDFQGTFSVIFHEHWKQFVFGGDKRVFIAGKPGRWESDQTVSVIAQYRDRIAVAEPAGSIRLLDASLKLSAGEPLRSGVSNPVSLAFNPSGDPLVAIGSIDGSVVIAKMTERLLETAAPLPLRSGAVQSLAFIDSQTVVAGTADGRIHFLGRDAKSGWTLLQSAKLHFGGIASIAAAGPTGDLVTSGLEGIIRRTPLNWQVFGVRISLLDLFRNPRAPSQIENLRSLRQLSEQSLHRSLNSGRLTPTGDNPQAADAERIYYGRQPVALSYSIPGGAFIRKSETQWIWERDGMTTILRGKSPKSVDASAIVLHHEDSGFTVTIPKTAGGDRRIRFGGVNGSWPAAIVVRNPNETSAVIRYAESYLENTGDGWRIRTPERSESNEHEFLPDYSFSRTLAELSDAAETDLRLRAENDRDGRNTLRLPRAGGAAEWSGARPLQLFRATRSEGPGVRSVHTSGQRKTVYEAVSINGQGPVSRAGPGQELVLEFRWSVEIDDRTPETNCPGCGVQMDLGMKGGTRDVDRDEAITRSFLKCIVNDAMPPAYYPGSSGRVKMQFKAPLQSGLYYITHLQAWDFGCDPIAAKFDRFSTSPKDAVAVVRVD